MSWDHYLPRWVLREFRDEDGNYYTLHRGAAKPHLKPLTKTGARLDMNKTTAPDGTVFDSEPCWSQWDDPAGAMASKVAKGASPATDLATVVIWATSLPLRAPFWRDALELETDAHTSNTHSLYLARAFVAPQVAEAFNRDAVSSEILVAPDGKQFISGDCGCIFVEHPAVASSSFVLPGT